MDIKELLRIKSIIQKFNREFIEELDHDWNYDVIPTEGSMALRTYILKPYFNYQGKESISRSDGYTVHFPTMRLTYQDKRTEYFFKQNNNELEIKLQKRLMEKADVCL